MTVYRTSVSGAVNEGRENNFFPSSFLLENTLLKSTSGGQIMCIIELFVPEEESLGLSQV